MTIVIRCELLEQLMRHGEKTYPEEGTGFLLGRDGEERVIEVFLPMPNGREQETRRNRYLITPEDTLKAEDEADARGLSVLGVFHSHPDHPDSPSEFDLEWALPWFSYVITSVQVGKSVGSRCWRLGQDPKRFIEESMLIIS